MISEGRFCRASARAAAEAAAAAASAKPKAMKVMKVVATAIGQKAAGAKAAEAATTTAAAAERAHLKATMVAESAAPDLPAPLAAPVDEAKSPRKGETSKRSSTKNLGTCRLSSVNFRLPHCR